MKFKIKVRRLTDEDVCRECPFPATDEDTYQMHLIALIQNIQSIPGVNDACLISGDELMVETFLGERDLKNAMKPFFSRSFCALRLVDLSCFS